jgi:hypothetical protein
MRRSLFFVFFAMVFCICAMTSAAQAQATRTWVSGVGDDANPCSRTAPCKTFPGAYSKTAAGGEIDVLDPGGFGTVTISKALTIDGGSQFGSILSAGVATGVRVTAGASDQVTLRHLWINGVSQYISPGVTGIIFTSGRTLDVESCVLENFTTFGIDFEPTNSSELHIYDTTIENAGNAGVVIGTAAGAGGVNRVQMRNVKIYTSGGHGVQVGQNSRVSIYGSVVSKNGLNGSGHGIFANGANLNVNVDDTQVVNNGGNGITASAGATVRVSNSTISDNLGQGTVPGTGSIFSGLNNRVANNNGGNGSFSGPIPLT